MRPPDFIYIGARKTASSSIRAYLEQHPGLHMPPYKRLRFFSRAVKMEVGSDEFYRELDTYMKMSDGAAEGQLVGEVCSGYMHAAGTARLISKYAPEAKIVIVLRDPADRAYSEYMMQVRDGRETRPFSEFIRKDSYYVKGSFYGQLLAEFFELFPRDRVGVFFYEDLVRDARTFMSGMESFIGVDPDFIPDMTSRGQSGATPRSRIIAGILNRKNPIRDLTASFMRRIFSLRTRQSIRSLLNRLNSRSGYLPLTERQREQLAEILADDINKLNDLTGLEFDKWSTWEKANV